MIPPYLTGWLAGLWIAASGFLFGFGWTLGATLAGRILRRR